MTTAKRVGLVSIATAAVAGGAAYYVGGIRLGGVTLSGNQLTVAALGLIAGVTLLTLLLFWRRVHGAVTSVSGQLEHMMADKQIGLVMVESTDELARLIQPLNEFISTTKAAADTLRAENRELQIQSRIAAAEKNHTEAIIFSITDAVIVTNRFDELILANESAEKLLGFKLESSLRKNIDRIISDGTLVRLIRETRSHRRNFTRKVVEHCIDPKGTPRTFDITLSCVAASNAEVSGVVAVLHDVTREKEISRMKTDFVSNVSHELKTPLASIKAYVEMLIDGEAEDEQTRREFYEIIATETDRLHRLIENILNISRIESGVVRIVREPMSLTAVAKQVLDVVAPQAKCKGITIDEQFAPVYYQVEADRDMIYQATMNLLSNALKYTPPNGKVIVRVRVDERRGVAVCEVADTGLGIPAEDLPHIFDKFYRVRANRKVAKGTGLGLTLVKHIIETAHDGKLTVTSEEGKGSVFSFELPVLA